MHIRPADRDDIPDIATLVSRATFEDEISIWLSTPQSVTLHNQRNRVLRSTKRRWNAGMILLVMVTDEHDDEWDGRTRIIGYAAYEKVVGAEDDSSKVSATRTGVLERLLFNVETLYHLYLNNNQGTIRERVDEWDQQVSNDAPYDKYDRYWELSYLAADPDYYRRGIGSALIDWGQERAAQDNAPILLWASKKGHQLYKRKGFKTIRTLEFSHGLDIPEMVWTPGSDTLPNIVS